MNTEVYTAAVENAGFGVDEEAALEKMLRRVMFRKEYPSDTDFGLKLPRLVLDDLILTFIDAFIDNFILNFTLTSSFNMICKLKNYCHFQDENHCKYIAEFSTHI